MDPISKTIKKSKLINNVINVNVNNSNNVNNDSNETYKAGKYELNRDSFNPNTEETQLAEEVATSLNDLRNYAFYLHVVKRLGISGTYSFWRSFQEEIEAKRGSRYEVRSPKKYFVWKFRRGL